MPKFPKNYEENLALVRERFPDRTMLTLKEVAELWGKSPITAKKVIAPYYHRTLGISVANVAKLMC